MEKPIFNPEDEVPSFDLCLKLKKLGYPQEGGGWYWEELPDDVCLQSNPKQRWILSYLSSSQIIAMEDGEVYRMSSLYARETKPLVKAPSSREIERWLPSMTDTRRLPDGRYCCCGKFKVVGDTEPNARVEMLIQLRIKGIVDFKQMTNQVQEVLRDEQSAY